jgi:hypothetical protein
MYNRHHRLWIAISVVTLVIVSSYRVLAKPQVRSKAIIASQINNKAGATDQVSPQPVDVILENVRIKPKARKAPTRPAIASKSVGQNPKKTRHINAERSSQGVEVFTNTERVNSRANAIDRLLK